MRYSQCKCGELQFFGSMSPFPCSWCEKCQTGIGGKPERIPHEMEPWKVETDEGYKILSRCRWCMQKKRVLEENGEPMNFQTEG